MSEKKNQPITGKQGCRFCDKEGLRWLPLRYAAIVSDEQETLDTLPALSGTLGRGVTDIGLKRAVYGVRLLRAGFLYVLLSRKGVRYWTAYQVLSDGLLYEFPPNDPPPPVQQVDFTCERHTCGVNASMVAIPKAAEVDRAWALFTPTPMTPGKLLEYKSHADRYEAEGRLQGFSPAAWVAGRRGQTHTLHASQLRGQVCEFRLWSQEGEPALSPLGRALQQQLYPACEDAYLRPSGQDGTQAAGRLGALLHLMGDENLPAFVLHDAIGITQELNNFRNAAMDELKAYLDREEAGRGVSNRRRLHVLTAIDDVREAYIRGVVTSAEEFQSRHREQSDQRVLRWRSLAQTLRLQGRYREAAQLERDADAVLARRERNYAEGRERAKAQAVRNWDRYARKLDLQAMDRFRTECEAVARRCEDRLQARADDHLAWLRSEALLRALHAYDREDPVSGGGFRKEVGLALFGMNCTEAGMALVQQWATDLDIAPDNLLMRANCVNQAAVEAEVRQGLRQLQAEFAAAPAPDMAMFERAMTVMKNATTLFEKVDDLLEHLPHGHGGTPAGMALVGYALLGQAAFRTRLVPGEAWFGKLYLCFLGSTLGRLNARIRWLDLMHQGKPLPDLARSQQQLTRAVKRALEQEILDSPRSQYYKLRVAAVVTLMEGVGFLMRALDDHGRDAVARERLELLGAGLVVTSAAFEMLAEGVELAARRYTPRSATVRGASIVLGGIRFWAGALAMAGGAIGAVYDFVDARGAARQEKRGVAGLLALRGMANNSLAMTGFIIGFSYCGPLFDFARRIAVNEAVKMHAGRLLSIANAAKARMSLLLRVTVGLNLAGMGLSFVLFLVEDDALEAWCERCSFRKDPDKNQAGFPDQDAELDALYRAFLEVR